MISSPRSPIFITPGQSVHEFRQSYMDHNKNIILGETFAYDMNSWIFHVWRYFSIYSITIQILLKCVSDVLGICTVLLGKLCYKYVRVITFLGVISTQTKSFCLIAQHQCVYKIQNSPTVLGDHYDLKFAGDFMLSGHPGYEPLKITVATFHWAWNLTKQAFSRSDDKPFVVVF